MSKVAIRFFKPADAKAVAGIMWKAFEFSHGGEARYKPSYSPVAFRKISFSRTMTSRTVSYVAEVDGKVAGYARGTVNRLSGLGGWDVVGVDEQYAHQGIGSALMKKMEDFFRQNKMRKVSTCVTSTNIRAVLYYFKHGFVIEGYRKDHFREGQDEIILAKFYRRK